MKLQKTRFAAALLATTVGLTTATGCKSMSGWKMPGMGMFSSAREPDASLLAGSTPEVEMPTSPANKYDPSTSIATTPPKSAGGTSPYGGYTAPSGYGAPKTSVPGQTVSTPTGGGLAAKSNGYRVGPYDTAGQSTSPPATGGSTYGTPGTSTGTSPYGGTYGGKSTTPPTSAYNPSATAQPSPKIALPSYGAGTVGPAAKDSGTGSGMPSYPSLPAPGASPSLTPPTSSITPPKTGTNAGASTTPAFPPIPDASSVPPTPALATPSLQPPTSFSAPPSSGGYAPGTTSRTTPYDFSGSGKVLPPNTATAPASNPLLR